MRRTALAVLLLLLCLSSYAADDPTYTALRAAAPDGRVVTLTNYVFEHDVFTFTLNGKLWLLAAVDGKTPGAVFVGQGSMKLVPATDAEARQLAIYAGKADLPELSDTFERSVFLGSALVDAAVKAAAPVQEAVPAPVKKQWDDYLQKQKKTLHTNLHLRVLQEQLDGGGAFFFAWVDGKTLPPAVVIVDPRGAEASRLTPNLGGEQSVLYVQHDQKGGLWYASRYRSEMKSGSGVVIPPVADAHHYLIDSTIRGAEIDATTTMTFVPSANLRVLPIDLTGKLEIASVEFATAGENPEWTAVPFVQEEDESDAAVIFPTAITKGKTYLLRTKYAGKEVLDDSGDGNFTVTRRTNWYPNVGVFSDLATYEMRFRTPEKFSIVGVGKEVENRVNGSDRITVWRADAPIRVAGFNYGKFKKLQEVDKANGTTFEVYTNTGTPDILREINMALSAATEAAMYGDEEAAQYAGSQIRIDAEGLSKAAMADGMNTIRTGNNYFGPLSDTRVAITQQSQWFFGQSWPTLIYLPYLAFLNGTQRNTLGLNDTKDAIDSVGPHEVAHQWWGHQVGFRTYRDQWLSEGFAEFTAALVAQQTGGWARYNHFFERARRKILEKPRGARIANHEAGPISQGWRVATWQNGNAYDAMAYSKGAYILHMLRMAMWDNKSQDEVFIRMMKDFAATYRGKEPTTADFQRIVEKHAPPSLQLTADKKLDWFFGQWVDGTAIPKYEVKITAKETGGGKYRISGTVTQSNVTDNFAMPVPIYVHFDKTNFIRLGATVIVGNSAKPIDVELALPKKPQKFTVNALHDVLAR
jgi:hypothetical protein